MIMIYQAISQLESMDSNNDQMMYFFFYWIKSQTRNRRLTSVYTKLQAASSKFVCIFDDRYVDFHSENMVTLIFTRPRLGLGRFLRTVFRVDWRKGDRLKISHYLMGVRVRAGSIERLASLFITMHHYLLRHNQKRYLFLFLKEQLNRY
jgi:hypothetical protein